MNRRTHYQVLGVQPDAEDLVIKAAYRALAQRYHPDKWSGDKAEAEQRMSEINDAYTVLSDAAKRREYDAELRGDEGATSTPKQDPSDLYSERNKYQRKEPRKVEDYFLRFKWHILFVVSLTITILGGQYLYRTTSDTQYSYKYHPLSSPKELDGITLNEPVSDFLFKNTGFTRLQSDKNQNQETVSYNNKLRRVTVRIKDEKVVSIYYICDNTKFDSTNINGIGCFDKGDRLLNSFVGDIRVLCARDKSKDDHVHYRVYDHLKFGVRYYLYANEIQAISIMDSARLRELTTQNWIFCP